MSRFLRHSRTLEFGAIYVDDRELHLNLHCQPIDDGSQKPLELSSAAGALGIVQLRLWGRINSKNRRCRGPISTHTASSFILSGRPEKYEPIRTSSHRYRELHHQLHACAGTRTSIHHRLETVHRIRVRGHSCSHKQSSHCGLIVEEMVCFPHRTSSTKCTLGSQ
jgi:hypothetical protein